LRAASHRETPGTVANTRDYALPSDLVEVLEVSVDGMPYGRATHTDLSYGAQGWLLLDGIGGRYFEDCREALPVRRRPCDFSGGVAPYAIDADNAERLWDLALRQFSESHRRSARSDRNSAALHRAEIAAASPNVAATE